MFAVGLERPPSSGCRPAGLAYGGRVRRPSPAMLVALLALFVALGGPAQAKHLIDGKEIRRGTITTAQLKDRTVAVRDLAPRAVRSLRETADGSITATKLGPGAVGAAAIADGTIGAGDLADGAIAAGKLADSAVTGAKIADGSLTAADIARFSGAFRILAEDLGTIKAHACWSREPRGLAPELAGADISQDALLVVPRGSFPAQAFSFNYRTSPPNPNDPGAGSRFVLTLCNRTDADEAPSSIAFSYIVFDLP
jgi:hypothetical protein